MKRQKTNQPSEHLLATREEQAVIGIMLLAPKSYAKIAGSLTLDDFFDDQCREMFQAAKRLHSKEQPADSILLLRELKSVPPVGEPWAAAIAKFATMVPHTIHLSHYMDAVKEASARRELVRQCEECIASIKRGDNAVDALKRIVSATTQ